MPPPAAIRAGRGATRSAAGRWPTASPTCCAGRGDRPVRDDGRDRAVHAREGDRLPAAQPAVSNTRAPPRARPTSGGFLDPIEGTLLLTAVGIAIAAPLGVAAGDMDERVSAARLAGAGGRVERGDDRGRAERAAGDVRPGAVRPPGAGVPLADLGRRGRCTASPS